MSRKALVLLVCCCDFRDGAERLMPSKSLGNAVIRAFPGLFRILRMCAPRRAAAVVRPRGREKSADRRRRILISRLLIIRAAVPRRKSPFPAYFKGFPAISPLIPPYPAFLKYPVSPQQDAEDAVHHAFMKIAESITAIDPVSPKTKQFVVTIVDNRVTDMLRMNGRHPAVEYNDEILSGLSSELHTDDLLTEAILKLPEQQRHVIWLKYYHGYSLREISKMLGITLSWAQKIDQRAKKQLEILYKEGGGEF